MPGTLFFITHPEVVVDRTIPVTSWSLSEAGRGRIRAFVAGGALAGVGGVYSSGEVKAREAAAVVAGALGLGVTVVAELGENDRSSTGYLPKERFEAAADQFFARPDESFQGWETARDAQRRIARAVDAILLEAPASGDVAIISHGAVGTLYKCHVGGLAIDRQQDQVRQGCYFRVDRASRRLLHGWVLLPEG